jgi:hypothetical protein
MVNTRPIVRTGAFVLLFVWCLASAVSAEEADTTNYLAYTVDARVVVADPEEVAFELSTWAEESTGYFVLRSLDYVSLRLPPGALPGLRAKLGELAFEVISYDPAAEDVRQELSSIEVGLRSREESLEAILGFLEGADVAATLAFEREMMAILAEIESLEGRRRDLTHRAAFARVDVALSSRQSELPVNVPSSFAWINTVGLERFLRETQR